MPGAPQSLGNEEQRAAESGRAGKVAAGISDPKEKRRFIARQGEDETAERQGKSHKGLEKIAAETTVEQGRQQAKGLVGGADSGDTTRTLRSYKKGGVVKKTGAALLHRGERVLSKEEAEGDGEKPQEIRIKRAGGGYIISHHYKGKKSKDGGPVPMPQEPTEHVVGDMAGLHSHLDDHLGEEALSE